jgi:hypothetical protein
MAASGDTSEADYDDRPRGPAEPMQWPPKGTKPAWTPLRLSLTIGSGFALCAVLVLSSNFLNPGVRGAADRISSSNNLKQIGLAVHNYADDWGQLPHNTYAPDGKPLLSWRVHILPYIEQDALYNRFDLDEPWDGPGNIRLLAEMPRIYARPQDRNRLVVQTYYRGFSSPGAVFERRPSHRTPRLLPLLGRFPDPRPGLQLPSLQDGTSETILVVEAGDPVEWTKPDDLDASPGKPFPKMGGMGWRKVFQAAFADGTVRILKLDTPEATLRALVTYNGGEPLPADWMD